MIDEGVLENPKVDAAFGCHIWPSIKAGHVAIKDGAMMSHSLLAFEIIFQGKEDMPPTTWKYSRYSYGSLSNCGQFSKYNQ